MVAYDPPARWWPLWGAAYQRTGDEKYARAFVAQLLDWIDKQPDAEVQVGRFVVLAAHGNGPADAHQLGAVFRLLLQSEAFTRCG